MVRYQNLTLSSVVALPSILKPVAIEFTTTGELQLEDVAAILQQAFHAPADAPFLDRALLKWKYYQPGPSLAESRSYVLSDKGRLLAHAAAWPVELKLEHGLRTGIGFGDWAATEEQRGIGLLLLKKLTALASFVLVIGGAEITRQILPRAGFKHWADLPVYAKVLRPFRQMQTRPGSIGWKGPLRLARNAGWSLARSGDRGDWTAAWSEPEESVLSALHQQTGSMHSAEFLRYALTCPAVPIRYLALRKLGAPHGYAVVSVIDGQARITDIRITTGDQEQWPMAVAPAVRFLASDQSVCEIATIASTEPLRQAFEANGFRVRDHRPLVIFDSTGRITQEPLPQIGMLVDDSAYLQTPASPYLT